MINKPKNNFNEEVYELLILANDKKNKNKYVEQSNYSSDVKKEVLTLLSFDDEDDNDQKITDAFSRDVRNASGESELLNLTGQKIDETFILINVLNYTGNSAIYLADRIKNNNDNFSQKIAVKIVLPIIERVVGKSIVAHEAQIISSCKHNNIVKVFNSSRITTEFSSYPCLIMEHIEGENLLEYIRKNNPPIKKRLALFNDICSAVQYLHSRPIIHGDLKPENILVDELGVVKIIDFTLGYSEISSVSNFLGVTEGYASPEQYLGEMPTVQSDIYSLGVILKDLIIGRDNSQEAQQWSQISFVIRAPIRKVYRKSCQLSPYSRYKTVEKLSADIYKIIHKYPISIDKRSLKWNIINLFMRRPIWTTISMIFSLGLLFSYSSQIKMNQLLIDNNKKLLNEMAANEDVTSKLSSILKYVDIRYRNGKAIDSKKLIEMTEAATSGHVLPEAFKLTMSISYGDVKNGNGNLKGAINHYLNALTIADSLAKNKSTKAFSRSSVYLVLNKLIDTYLNDTQVEEARRISEKYIKAIDSSKDLSIDAVNFILAYLDTKSTYVWTQPQGVENFTALIKNFIRAESEKITEDEKLKVSFKYATALYYGHEGTEYSITTGKTDEYINEHVIPSMMELKLFITDTVKKIEKTHYLYPEFNALLSKISYEIGNYEDVKKYGIRSIDSAINIYQTKYHTSVLGVYLKYFSALINTDIHLAKEMIEEAMIIEKQLLREKKITSAFAHSFKGGAMYYVGNLKDLEKLNKPDKNDFFLRDKGTNWWDLIYTQSFPFYTDKTSHYIDKLLESAKNYEYMIDLDVNMQRLRAKLMRASFNKESLDDVIGMNFELFLLEIDKTYYKAWHYVELSLIFAISNRHDESKQLLKFAQDSIVFNSREIKTSPGTLDFQLMLSQSHFLNKQYDEMRKSLAIARNIFSAQKMHGSVHDVLLSYLEMAYAFNMKSVTKDKYNELWKKANKKAVTFGYDEKHPIISTAMAMKVY